MKILILSTSERTGGAAVAANRLMHALNKSGQEARMLVRDKQTEDTNVISINTRWWKKKINFVRFAYERWVIFLNNRFSRKNLFAVSMANTGADIRKYPLVKEADIIHLHWINQGFLSLKSIRQLINLNKPVVWTMHDMWCFTGVCHYAGPCRNYESECATCPAINNHSASRVKGLFAGKRTVYSPVHFVGCSDWVTAAAKKSALLHHAAVTAIPNPIDVDVFKPVDKNVARKLFNLPENKKLILFTAIKLSDERKGIHYFIEASNSLKEKNTEVVFLGGKIDEAIIRSISLRTYTLGYLQTPADIAAAYSACDVFVTPSLEENLPNTIMEAMACGTPCVGFNVGGIPEMIDHKQTGYVAEYKNAEDLAVGMKWCLENHAALSAEARLKVMNNYTEERVAGQYIELYQRILKNSN